MKNLIIPAYNFNLRYAKMLVADVPDHLMTHSPTKGLENHPAFTLGHLVSAAALTAKYIGAPYEFDPNWEKLFKRKGPGDPTLPDPDNSKYPSKEELLDALTNHHKKVESLILDLSEEQLNKPIPWRFKEEFPTLGSLLLFMCITHEAMHLGQLPAWRRAMNLPSALAKL